jgi:NAD(P)-dependent dehydrogenase (short-subunit alcohol dehydrogenase family)
MTINARGSFLCYKYAAEQMIKQGRGGRIIGASSLAGKMGLSVASAYCASKFAVRGLTQAAGNDQVICHVVLVVLNVESIKRWNLGATASLLTLTHLVL